MRAQIVEQQDFGVEREPIGFLVAGAGFGAVSGADAVQQILVIEEQAFMTPRR